MPLNSFSGCSNSALANAPLSHIRFLPTKPLEFASPFGNCLDFESSSSLADSTPFAQTTTAFARCSDSLFCASKYTAPVARPRASVTIFRTYELGRISQRPVFSAIGITLTSVLDFARTSQPNDSQKPQFTQALRPW